MKLQKNIAPSAIALILIVSVFGTGFYVGKGQTSDTQISLGLDGIQTFERPDDIDFDLYWEVWQKLDTRFIGTSEEDIPSNEERLWGSIEGLADSFGDPHTAFLPPAEATLFKEDIRGNFGGVGMEISVENNLLTVIAPLRGTPADRAGIQAGDIIAKIDGESTANIDVDEAVQTIRGEIGTPVILTIIRQGENELLEIEVIRDTINVPTLSTELRSDDVFVISLFSFGATAPNEFRGALREFLLSGSSNLILDLRGNPGGFLNAAVDISSWFLPLGKIVVQEKGGEETLTHRSRGYNVFDTEDMSMVILVNGGSASASEIVAGALRDHGIAQIVGTQTFGKGSVQEIIPVGDDSSLRVTIAHWNTPNGTSISDEGLTPDVVVEITRDDVVAGNDIQLNRAVELLLES